MTDSDFVVFVVCIAIVYAGAVAQVLWGPDRTPSPRGEAYYSWSKPLVVGIEMNKEKPFTFNTLTLPHPR